MEHPEGARQAYSIKLAIRTTLQTLAIPSFFGRPSSPRFAQSFPPRGSLNVRKGFPFLLNFALSKMKQGEAYIKGRNFKFMRFATVRYGTPEGCAAGVLDKARDSHYSPNACDIVALK